MGKRLFDLALVFVAAPFYCPVIVSIALWIWLRDGRPIFFLQERLGKGRQTFKILKFRTMREGQVTPVGEALRKTGLDELSQVWNILKGEMSFVGPRPLTQADVDRLGWNDRALDDRWRMKPGMTGLAQLYAGRGAQASLSKDRLYMARHRRDRDLAVLGATFLMNIFGKNRVRPHIAPVFDRIFSVYSETSRASSGDAEG